jgi:predicted lipoprotein
VASVQTPSLALHDAREQALVAGLAHAATQRQALRSAGLEIVRTGSVLEAKRSGKVLGRWWPDRRPQVGSRSVKDMPFERWLLAVVRAWNGTPSGPR